MIFYMRRRKCVGQLLKKKYYSNKKGQFQTLERRFGIAFNIFGSIGCFTILLLLGGVQVFLQEMGRNG